MLLRHLIVLLASCSCLAAQRLPAWSTLTLPGGVNPTAVQSLGKVISYAEGGRVHAYSAVTRAWHTLSTGGAIVRNANDWALIQSGTTFTAFSSARGTFESITVSAGASVVNPTTQRNDSIILIRDGNLLYAFSGLQGFWVSKSISPAAMIAVERNVAIIADQTTLFGMSAYQTVWVPWVTLTAATQVFASGTMGVAWNASTIWGFSAQQASWQGVPALAASAGFAAGDDVAVWSDSTRALGFSGVRGEFDLITTGMPTTLLPEQQVAVASSGTAVFFFSAARARWTALMTLAPPLIKASAATVLVQDQGAVHAYSSLRGTVATLPITPGLVEVGWTVGAARDQLGALHLYSSFTGQWHAGPPGSQQATPFLAFQAVLLQLASSTTVFSARSGGFAPIAATGVAYAEPESGIVAIAAPQALHVFDPRREAWLTQPLSGGPGPVAVYLWRTSLVAVDGARAYGFGSLNGVIEAVDLPGPLVEYRANSESISLITPNALVAFSTVPEVSSVFQFPEFRRMYAPGSPVDLTLRGPAGAIGGMLLGLPLSRPLPLSIGPVFLHPAAMFPVWAGVLSNEQRAVARLSIPDSPVVSGLPLAFQGAVLTPSEAWTTDMSSLYVP